MNWLYNKIFNIFNNFVKCLNFIHNKYYITDDVEYFLSLKKINMILAIDSEHGIAKKECILNEYENVSERYSDSGCDLDYDYDNIPWDLPEDLSFFKTVTYNSVIIMGKNTFKTLNYRHLPGRINIVVTRNIEELKKDMILHNTHNTKTIFTDSLELALLEAQSIKCLSNEIYIIGGKTIYDQMFQNFRYMLNHIYVTHVFGDYQCDKQVYFPEPLKQIYRSQEYTSVSSIKYVFYKLCTE